MTLEFLIRIIKSLGIETILIYAYNEVEIVYQKLENIESEIFYLGNNNLAGCYGCGICRKLKNGTCDRNKDDLVNLGIEKMIEADGIVFGSPVHFAGVSSGIKAFLDRAFYVSTANGGLFNQKVGAAVVAVRRGGGTAALEQLNKYIAYDQMIQIHANYWSAVHGAKSGEIEEDAEGLQVLDVISKNMVYLLKALEYSKGEIEKPEKTKKIYTNFVR